MSHLHTNNLVCLLLAAVLVVLALATSPVLANEPTRDFLLQFRNAFDALKTFWPDTSTDYCSWSGVRCNDDNGTVALNLAYKQLAGKLPALDEKYRNKDNGIRITGLWLGNNGKITGTLDLYWEYLVNLTGIDVSYTSVEGTLPQAWESLKLERLYVHVARLCGSMPNWNMSSLRYVLLRNNTMGGSLSDSWSTMTSLESIKLYDNGFCGCVPASWASNAALSEAAKDLPAAVRASDCATKNKCVNYDRCKSTASGVASLVASMTAIAAVAAAMFL